MRQGLGTSPHSYVLQVEHVSYDGRILMTRMIELAALFALSFLDILLFSG